MNGARVKVAYRLGDRAVSVRVSPPELRPAIDRFFLQYRLEAGGVPGPPEIRLEREGARYRLTGPSGDWYADAAGAAVALYEAELNDVLLEGCRHATRLHAAASRIGGGAWLLVGESGAGKSTLTAGLLLAGHEPLGDDVVLVGDAGLKPYHRPMRVHREGLGRLGLEEAPAGSWVCAPYTWIDPVAVGPGWAGPEPLSRIVFLQRSDRTRLVSMASAQALRRLLVARFGPGRPERDFDRLAALVRAAPAGRLEYRDLPDALSALLEARPDADASERESGQASGPRTSDHRSRSSLTRTR